MSVKYKGIGWNRQKRIYDAALAALVLASLITFAAVTAVLQPYATIETIIIRATAWTAILLLHVILCIGPLARLDARFLPLLYNRRHLGVTMFLLALVHGVFATIQFHALGRVFALVSVFTAYRADYDPIGGPGGGIGQFPFEPFGAFALVILFLMAATSHDFWLRNLGASFWKLMHMLVYVAYGSLIVHVAFGALQSERNPVYIAVVAIALVLVLGLHLAAYRRESAIDRAKTKAEDDGYIFAYRADAIADGRGKSVKVGDERVAIFRHGARVFAMSNVCRHQGGPVGEGRIVDGCVTCPWHGWQYKPEDGCSPPPFAETLPTYPVRVVDGAIYVLPAANPLGSRCDGAVAANSASANCGSEFYVGYLKTAPVGLARFTRQATVALAVAIPCLTVAMAAAQHTMDRGVFEFGVVRLFSGTLFESPLPMLRVGGPTGESLAFPLVGAGKAGLPEFARGHDGMSVEFAGSLIRRDGVAMIEMNDAGSFRVTENGTLREASRAQSLGRVTLCGELVDTKCFFGVMRPAVGKVHRACAVRCLDGGVPPGLLLRLPDSSSQVIMLAGPEGRSLDCDPQWAALTVRASGTLELHDGLPVLRTSALDLDRVADTTAATRALTSARTADAGQH